MPKPRAPKRSTHSVEAKAKKDAIRIAINRHVRKHGDARGASAKKLKNGNWRVTVI